MNKLLLQIHGILYDLTAFASSHPGGAEILFQYNNKDATEAFDSFHSIDILRLLPPDAKLGLIAGYKPVKKNVRAITDFSKFRNLFDFENVAKEILTASSFNYISSGGEDEVTMLENQKAFKRILFKPRVLRNVSTIDTSSVMLGYKAALPIYISAAAQSGKAHGSGEVGLSRAATANGIIQMIPMLHSCTLEEIVGDAPTSQFWFQVYVNKDKEVVKKLITKQIAAGIKVFCLTVDRAQLGKREKDFKILNIKGISQNGISPVSDMADPGLDWNYAAWFQKTFPNAIFVLKGIQTGEDAVLAARNGIKAIIVSNHGGRQLDSTRSSIETLVDVQKKLRDAKLEKELEVYLDGGIRRGSDVFKALALGAKGVGLGRPFLYSLAVGGQSGVEKAIEILREEFEICMRLCGVTSIDQINPSYVITKSLFDHSSGAGKVTLADCVYEPLKPLYLSSKY